MEFIFDNERPIYIQLVEQLELYIISGKIPPGEKLPSIRNLATQFQVNPNTIQRALTELEDKGLIQTERTNGKFITTNCRLIEITKTKYIYAKITGLFQDLESIGFTKHDIIKIFKKLEEGES